MEATHSVDAQHGTGGACCGGKQCGSGGCACPHHKATAVLVILFALLFLLGNLGVLGAGVVQVGWPILLGIAGFMKLCEGKCTCC